MEPSLDRIKNVARTLVLPAVLTLLVGANAAASMRGSFQSSPPSREAIVEARRNGGLYAAAVASGGHYRGVTSPHWDIQLNHERLTKFSSLIVIGEAQDNLCVAYSSDGEETIVTKYDFQVGEVFKGSASTGSVIKVALPGGRVEFEDGKSAEIQLLNFRKMENGKRYLLFLTPIAAGSNIYVPVAGPQGVFEAPLGSDASIRSTARAGVDTVTIENQNVKVQTFVDRTRTFVVQWPQQTPCCE